MLLKVLLCCLSVGLSLSAHTEPLTERTLQIKAAYIYNFTNFITWDEIQYESENFIFCIVEDQNFSDILLEIINNRPIANKHVLIKNITFTDIPVSCNVLYLPQESVSLNKKYLKNIFMMPILTVGNSVEFNHQGGIIRFYTDNNKIKFEINYSKAIEVGLKIDSQLLLIGGRPIDE